MLENLPTYHTLPNSRSTFTDNQKARDVINRYEYNNFFCLDFIILYLIVIIPIQFTFVIKTIIYFVIVYQIKYIFYKFMIKV